MFKFGTQAKKKELHMAGSPHVLFYDHVSKSREIIF